MWVFWGPRLNHEGVRGHKSRREGARDTCSDHESLNDQNKQKHFYGAMLQGKSALP